jgi:Fic family protein
MTLEETYSQIDQLRKELDELRPLSPEVERKIMDKFRLDWNFHSSKIEGNSLTFGETRNLLLHGITANGKPLRDHFEIEGHDEAVKLLTEIISLERPLTEGFIRELHETILKKPYEVDAITPDGKPTKRFIKIGNYKETQNHVVTKTGEIFRFAEPGKDTEAQMTDLLNFYHKELKGSDLHSVWLASIFHYKFILIHPFDDGNGRIGRILMNIILMQKGYPPVIIKENDKENYYRVLRLADGGDLESFVIYIGEQLIRSLDLMIKGAKGGNIDEPEDWDKKIALLKKKVQSVNSENDFITYKAYQAIVDIYNKSLKKLFLSVIEQVNKFTEFYADSSFLLGANENFIPVPIENAFEMIEEEYIYDNDRLNELKLQCALTIFLKGGLEDIQDILNMRVVFHESYYEIHIFPPMSSSPVYYKKRYHQLIDDSEILKISTQVKQSFYNVVEYHFNQLK